MSLRYMISTLDFRYKKIVGYVMFYAGVKMNMENKNSMTISARDVLDFYESFAERGLDINLQQSNLSRAINFMVKAGLLIPAGIVNRQKRYYFNFKSHLLNFVEDRYHKYSYRVLTCSKDLVAYLFIYNCKKIFWSKKLDGEDKLPGNFTLDDIPSKIAEYEMLYDLEWVGRRLEDLSDKKWFTMKDKKFLTDLLTEYIGLTMDDLISNDTLG